MVLLLTSSVASGAKAVLLIIWSVWKPVFFDFEKAYDTTWKYDIMRDLSDFGLKGRLPHFIENFLSNRNFKVRVRPVG